MKVILAGFNVDTAHLLSLTRKKKIALTPETIAAAYARISRSNLSVTELRKKAREEVEKARKSAKRIIFDMGHHSIAEHAVFNFDIIGISRLAVEEVERFRLGSYTEKSQRYVIFEKGYFIPPEIRSTSYEKNYSALIAEQFEFYHYLIEKIKAYILQENKGIKEKDAENRAKEDARYCLPLATTTQLGMTINARNLEYLLRNSAAAPLREIRELGKRLFSAVKEIAPSLLLFYQSTAYEEKRGEDLRELIQKNLGQNISKATPGTVNSTSEGDVRLIYYNPDSEPLIAAALLYPYASLPFGELKKIVLGKEREILKTACRYLEFYDALPREFELAHFIFEITLSASAFAQLKRHRMATLIKRPYSPELGFVLPPSIAKIGEGERFKDLIAKTNQFFYSLEKSHPAIKEYILTNAHKRRVLLGLNARELYHLSRLRSDATAQWEIRKISDAIVKIVQRDLPLLFFLLSGKDKYHEVYKDVYGCQPKFRPPKI